MIKLLVALWLATYILSIGESVLSYIRVRMCIKALRNFVTAYIGGIKTHPSASGYTKELDLLLRRYVWISEFVDNPKLSYADSVLNTAKKADELLAACRMVANFKRNDILRSLNPLPAVRQVITLPVTILNWLGFTPGKTSALFASITGWVAAYFLNMFQSEIKSLIISLFEHFI